MRLHVCLLSVILPLLAGAADIPQPVLPEGVGVNIHFVTGQERDLDLIAAAGFKLVRMDFHWQAVEPRKGEYDWAGYEELLTNLEKRGLRAILILDYSHHLYEEEVTSPHPQTGQAHKTISSPQHPESVAAFARWAAAAAKHFQGRRVLWEIWNEPNIHFWSSVDTRAHSIRLRIVPTEHILPRRLGSGLGAPAIKPHESGMQSKQDNCSF